MEISQNASVPRGAAPLKKISQLESKLPRYRLLRKHRVLAAMHAIRAREELEEEERYRTYVLDECRRGRSAGGDHGRSEMDGRLNSRGPRISSRCRRENDSRIFFSAVLPGGGFSISHTRHLTIARACKSARNEIALLPESPRTIDVHFLPLMKPRRDYVFIIASNFLRRAFASRSTRAIESIRTVRGTNDGRYFATAS